MNEFEKKKNNKTTGIPDELRGEMWQLCSGSIYKYLSRGGMFISLFISVYFSSHSCLLLLRKKKKNKVIIQRCVNMSTQ